MLAARAALWSEFTKLHREMLKIARADKVCQRLMSTPGVGALVALTYRAAVDDLRRDNQDGNPATIRMRMRRCRGDEGRA